MIEAGGFNENDMLLRSFGALNFEMLNCEIFRRLAVADRSEFESSSSVNELKEGL